MKIGVLTSSRADYGIYQPLLSKLAIDKRFQIEIIAFGMHLLDEFGSSIRFVEHDNFGKIHKIRSMPTSDQSDAIAIGYGQLVKEFGKFWSSNQFDIVLVLGDRFEMSAAVQASIPFGVYLAHIHGGETTLGAVDNIYRHQISLASKLHFAATDIFQERIKNLLGSEDGVFNVGALSLENAYENNTKPWEQVRQIFSIPTGDFILVTFHPETVGVKSNIAFSEVMFRVLKELRKDLNIVITLTNADAMGSCYTEKARLLKQQFPNEISLVSNFGRENYFAAMKEAKYLLGNTSSGIIEAASFGKYVINVGERQSGRLQSENVLNVPFDINAILFAANEVSKKGKFEGNNRYHKSNTVKQISEILANAKL